MNRNNFLIHLALAVVLILVAAFAGQLNRWRKQWKPMRVVPTAEKKRASTSEEIAVAEARILSRPEVLVKFKPGVSRETIDELTARFNDRVEDSIESDPGLESIDDLDDANADATAAKYSTLPE